MFARIVVLLLIFPVRLMKPTLIVILLVVQILFASTSSAQDTGVDRSYYDGFWKIQEHLAAGGELTDEQWDSYWAGLELANVNPAAVRRNYELAFSPQHAAEAEAAEGYAQSIIGHLRDAVAHRAEIDAFVDSVCKTDFMVPAQEATAKLMPQGTDFEPATPLVFLVFGPDAYGEASAIVVDAAFVHQMAVDDFQLLVAHELHHVVNDRISTLHSLDADDPQQPLLRAFEQLQYEGIADCIDKQKFPITSPFPKSSSFGEVYAKYVERYNEAWQATPQTLRTLDEAIRALPTEPDELRKAAEEFRQSILFGGHPNGFYMACLIRKELGHERLVATVVNSFDFLRAYQEAAAQAEGEFQFSPEAMEYLQRLEARVVGEEARGKR